MSDLQCGHEKTLSALLPALAGANIIYGMGMLELGMTFSYEQLLMDNEIAGMVKRVIQGIEINDDTMAVDLIKKVGAGGDFLAQEHTREYMSAEQSRVKMIDRRMRGTWEKRGGKTLTELAHEEAIKIIETYKPIPLEKEAASKIKSIIEETEERIKAGEL